MAPRRIRPIETAVHLNVDGDEVLAERGEPVTVALTAAGRLTLCRSVKYHRPRGAVCFGGRCDGCLMRVDGVASVMTCRLPADDGMRVETQNVVGTAKRDLLAATDWFFPDGMNHHEMFTWNEAINKVMQKVARRIAGIGTLPDDVLAPTPSDEREVDVLVVGGGPAGLHAAAACARAGRSVLLVDEEPKVGGSLRWWPEPMPGIADALAQDALGAGVTLRSRSSVVGVYDPWEDVEGTEAEAPARRVGPPVAVVSGPDGVTRVRPRRTVIATGRHLGASAFEDSDQPGVVDLRAACLLLSHGVLIGERVALVGEGALVDGLEAALAAAGAKTVGPFAEADVLEARGRTSVDGVRVRDGDAERVHDCDAIAVLPPTSAVYELAAQAGVEVAFDGSGYELSVGEAGATAAPDVRAVGWATGAAIETLDAVRAQAEAAAAAIVEETA